jgi:2-polyprenyl-3-methyl-5-hydroxy-6-metoxy-1,4-benzoquinol methylase
MRLRTAISKTGGLSGRIRFAKLQQHGELPFRYDGDNWPYDALCERQKRRGVRLSQYLTPDATARRIAALAVRYFENDSRIMDVCCGTGQLTRALIAEGVHPSQIVGLEVDRELADFYARLYPVTQTLIGPYRDIDFRCENVVANPPFIRLFISRMSIIEHSSTIRASPSSGFSSLRL